MPLYDKIGPDRLRAVITDFYARVFDDVMIGFLFAGKDRKRLIDKEFEFTAQLLGGAVKYTGRPMRAAHARVPIMGGHFDRRTRILQETLADHGVDPDVQASWLHHIEALRAQVTADAAGACNDVAASRFTEPAEPASAPEPRRPAGSSRLKLIHTK
jgi:hemoglobin